MWERKCKSFTSSLDPPWLCQRVEFVMWLECLWWDHVYVLVVEVVAFQHTNRYWDVVSPRSNDDECAADFSVADWFDFLLDWSICFECFSILVAIRNHLGCLIIAMAEVFGNAIPLDSSEDENATWLLMTGVTDFHFLAFALCRLLTQIPAAMNWLSCHRQRNLSSQWNSSSRSHIRDSEMISVVACDFFSYDTSTLVVSSSNYRVLGRILSLEDDWCHCNL